MTIRLIVYDLDGTLIDSVGHIAATVNRTRARHGLGPLTVDQVRPCIGDGARRLVEKALFGRMDAGPAPFSVLQNGPPFPVVFQDFYDSYLEDPTSGLSLMDGVTETLARLAAEGIHQAALTNKPHAVTQLAVDALDLRRYLPLAIGPDAVIDGVVVPPKPDPTGLRLVLAHFGVTPGDALMVGDGIQDARVAMNAGVRCVAIALTQADRELFATLAVAPVAVVHDFRGAATAVERLRAADTR